MNTKIYLLSFSFGLGLGLTAIHTSNPFGLLADLLAQGKTLEHVTITNTK